MKRTNPSRREYNGAMTIQVTAKPRSKKASVRELAPFHYAVAITAPASDGRANAAIITALAEYFGVSKASVLIMSGETTKQKKVEILTK